MSEYWTTIGEISQVFDGPHATPKKIEDGPYFLSISSLVNGALDLSKSAHLSDIDFAKWTKRVTPVEGDVLFSYETRLGDAALMPSGITACLGRRMGLLRPDREKVLPEYLLYAYLSPAFQETIRANTMYGATVNRIALKDMPNFSIRIPPMDEQVRVVNILKSLDEKLELNRQTNQTLEHMAQAIFKSWFVDFEPTRAKIAAKEEWAKRSMTTKAGGSDNNIKESQAAATFVERAAMAAISGRAIDSTNDSDAGALAGLDQLNPEQIQQLKTTAALFPDALVDSELGEIPEGWEVTELGELLEFNPKRTLKKGTMAPYLDMKNVPTQGHLANDVYLREMASGTKFINGDTLLARITPCLENGKTAYVDFLEDDQVAWGSTEYIVMRPKNGRPMSLGYIIARLDSFRSKAIQTMTGTSGRQRANAKALSEQLWLDYPNELLKVFDSIAGSYLEKAKENGDENETLTELRDALLPKLLSGELMVS